MHTDSSQVQRGSPVVSFALATIVAMWTIGYVTHLPFVAASPQITLCLLLVALFLGGLAFGYLHPRSLLRHAVGASCMVAVINLLILGSLLTRSSATDTTPLHPSWVILYFLATSIIFIAGFMIARLLPRYHGPAPDSLFLQACTTVLATGLLVIAGGLVTGSDAGLAVPDWPNSFTANMFLLPLSRMTGAIYYEHAHRLYGSLVGLSTIILAFSAFRSDPRRWIRPLIILAVLAVIIQGILGGFRVTLAHNDPTAGIARSTAADETTISAVLRVVHGVFGQVFLALLTALAVMFSPLWRSSTSQPASSAAYDRRLSIGLILALLVQLTLGAVYRHLNQLLMLHIAFACVVLLLAILNGLRAWGFHPEIAPLRRLGIILMFTAMFQVALGLAALVFTGHEIPLYLNAIVTTSHQAIGALLLVLSVILCLLNYRLLTPVPVTESPSTRASQEAHHAQPHFQSR